MDISAFTDGPTSEDTEYKYKVLVYGNYTFRENLKADSFVIVFRNIIKFLSSRYSIHFTILIPEKVHTLDFPNVDQIIYDLPSYPNQMRTHFDSEKFMKIMNWKDTQFDIVYSHLPEHTAQIANCLYNSTNMEPVIIGYSHWFEVKENAPYPKNMLLSNFAGMLEMEECGVNSKWLKDLILSYAKKQLSEKSVAKLEQIIQPHYLGVDQFRERNPNYEKKSVIFNHRDNGYTGWKWFAEQMDKLWEKRQDFRVYTTLAEIDRPWNKKVDCPTREEYLNLLSRMQFGVGCFQDYSAWSISATDGFSVNVPYLLPNKFCYPEMVPFAYPYLYHDDDFIEQFESMLDYPPTYDTAPIAEGMMWDSRIEKWFGGWDNVFNKLKKVQRSKRIEDVVQFIKKNRSVSKRDILEYLGWGVDIKFDRYRNYLRDIPEIVFTKDRYIWKP